MEEIIDCESGTITEYGDLYAEVDLQPCKSLEKLGRLINL